MFIETACPITFLNENNFQWHTHKMRNFLTFVKFRRVNIITPLPYCKYMPMSIDLPIFGDLISFSSNVLLNLQVVSNEKIFQSNANRPLSDNPCFIVNQFECDQGKGSLYSEVQVKHFQRASNGPLCRGGGRLGPCTGRKVGRGMGAGTLYGVGPELGPCTGTPPCRMTDTTRNITFPQLHWRAVTMNSTEPLNVIDTLSSIVAEFNCQIHFTWSY